MPVKQATNHLNAIPVGMAAGFSTFPHNQRLDLTTLLELRCSGLVMGSMMQWPGDGQYDACCRGNIVDHIWEVKVPFARQALIDICWHLMLGCVALCRVVCCRMW